MIPSELLERFAATLKNDVGPNVDAEYPRSQAYLGAVVLQKLAAQLRLEQEHKKAEMQEYRELQHDLTELLRNLETPAMLADAVARLGTDGDRGLSQLIETLHGERAALGADRFDILLARIRRSLRQSLDRRLEYAS